MHQLSALLYLCYICSMNIFERVFQALNEAKVKYLVVGGVAVNLHGYARFTGDLDLVLLLEENNLVQMKSVMDKLGYKERLPISVLSLSNETHVQEWLDEKNMKAFSFMPAKDNPLQIDIIIEESLQFDQLRKNQIMKRISDVSIPVISMPDLVQMKKKANRAQDLMDLEALIQLKDV